MESKDLKVILDAAKRDGWTVRRTNGGKHFRLEHTNATAPVITGAMPKDHRALLNLKAELKRALRSAAPLPASRAIKARKKTRAIKREAVEQFDMHGRPKGERRTWLRSGTLEDEMALQAELLWHDSLPANAFAHAWGLAVLRMRAEAMPWTLITVVKHRVRRDRAFRMELVNKWLETPVEVAAMLRSNFRAGIRPPPTQPITPAVARRPAPMAQADLAAQLAEATARLAAADRHAQALQAQLRAATAGPTLSKADIPGLLAERQRRVLAETERDAAIRERDAAIAAAPTSRKKKASATNAELLPPVSKAAFGADAPKADPGGFGRRLIDRRVQMALSQKALAAKVDVSGASISLWERSDKPPAEHRLVKLAVALSTSIQWLITGLVADPPERRRQANGGKNSGRHMDS